MSQANRRSLWTFTVLLALTLAAAAMPIDRKSVV